MMRSREWVRAHGRYLIVLLALMVLGAIYVAEHWLFARGEVLATIAETSGSVDRDFSSRVGAWERASIGEELFIGDGVRTGKESSARLALSDQSRLSLDSETLVRFLDREPASHAQRFDLQMGEAVLEAGDDSIAIETEIGSAVLEPKTRVAIRRADGAIRYEVFVGKARFESKDGDTAEISSGQGLTIGIGTARIERYDLQKQPVAKAVPAASEAASGAPAPAVKTGDVSARIAGTGATVRRPGDAQFSRLSVGETPLAAGSILRLANGTTADVARGGQRATLRGAGEFVVGESGKPFIVTANGSVFIAGAETEVAVAVPGGSILAKLGARADVAVRKDATHVRVEAGSVDVRAAGGTEALRAGEELTIGAKGTEIVGRGPGYVDFVAPAGGSFAVHDPRPPTAIGFSAAGVCPHDAVVELVGRTRKRAVGTGTVSILVPSGAHKYAVHCVGSDGIAEVAAASGSVAVLADAGTARIPRTAPATLVDTDGRNYTVLYQNLLPKISVRWPNAPAAASYTLEVRSPGGKSKTITSANTVYSFATGALGEGVHAMTFTGGGVRSKATHVEIKFDNAAPTATLTSPQNGGFAPGSAVKVAGLASEGWKISVGGKALSLDGNLRFSGDAVAPAAQRALAIEFAHPRRGVHYYLRRSAGH